MIRRVVSVNVLIDLDNLQATVSESTAYALMIQLAGYFEPKNKDDVRMRLEVIPQALSDADTKEDV